VTFAKGVTSGYLPLGGVLVGPRVREVLEADDERVLRHGFTYSGHPAACAAAVANLDVLAGQSLLSRAPAIGEVLGDGFAGLRDEGLVAGVRGTEAIWALAMHDGVDATAVRDQMLRRGVIARPIATHSVAVCPPLVIDDAELRRIVDVAGDALRALRGDARGARRAR
jgi:adenosylmethionine-8-amino-7-oxononanoate aminotransferase